MSSCSARPVTPVVKILCLSPLSLPKDVHLPDCSSDTPMQYGAPMQSEAPVSHSVATIAVTRVKLNEDNIPEFCYDVRSAVRSPSSFQRLL